MIGQLQADQVKPGQPFSVVGLDFAGPLWCKGGNLRKPTLVNAYTCLYICFMTKAVHIELESDLTSEAFLPPFTDSHPEEDVSQSSTLTIGVASSEPGES